MDNELKDIDKFYKDALKNYEPAKAKNNWFYLGFKLLTLNLGSYFVYGSIAILVGIGGTTLYLTSNMNKKTQTESTSEKNPILKIPAKKIIDPENKNSEEARNDYFNNNTMADDEDIVINQNFNLSESVTGIDEEEIPAESEPISHINNKPVYNYSNTTKLKTASNSTSATGITPLSYSKNGQVQFVFKNHTSGKILERTEIFDSLTFISKHAIKTSLSFYISPGYIQNKIKPNDNLAEHYSLRKSSENAIVTLDIGSEIKFKKNKWFLQTGLNYSVYGENSKYGINQLEIDPDKSVPSIDTTFMWYYDPPLISERRIVSIDTAWKPFYYYVLNTYVIKNRYHFLEIPVMAGRQFYMGRFTFEIGTGVSFGFLIKKRGQIPDINNESVINLKEISMTEPMINYLFQVGIEYAMSKRARLILKPNIKYSINSLFDDPDYSVNQKYFVVGLKTGISIDF